MTENVKKKIEFKHTLEKNICIAMKKNGGFITKEGLYAAFQDQSFVVDAFVKSLKNRKYLQEDDEGLHLDWYIYEKLMV